MAPGNEPQITGTGFPGVFYLKYDMYRQNFPLLALATYRQLPQRSRSLPELIIAAELQRLQACGVKRSWSRD